MSRRSGRIGGHCPRATAPLRLCHTQADVSRKDEFLMMTGWANFFLAQVGASAALTGLIFVAVSINLTKILAYPTLPGRALEALLYLLTVLVIGTLGLVPGQPAWLRA